MKNWQKTVIVCLMMMCTVGCDQVTKNIARDKIQYAMPLSFFHDTVRLEYSENSGAMLGLGSELPFHQRFWLLTVFTGLFLLAVPIYIFWNHDLGAWQVAGLSLALGGGASNLIDRWVNDGKVIDFLNLGIQNVRTGIFNVADVAVLVGFALFLTLSTRFNEEPASPDT